MKIYSLYEDMLQQPHLLIAGTTGSGKSVLTNGLIYTALKDSPKDRQFIFIDLKRVELSDYKKLPHCIRYASEPGDIIEALNEAINITDARYKEMQRAGLKNYNGGDVYVIIDELADLMTTNKKQVMPLLQRLCQIGRAARVHVVAATQCPLREVIPTPIKVNFDARVGLRTGSAQDSRNILNITGCEKLPNPLTAHRAEGYYKNPNGITLYNIPMIPEEEIQKIIEYWKPTQKPLFKKLTPAA